MSPLKALRWNIIAMSVTRATFQVEMSPLKAAAKANMPCMPVTWDTSQLEMSPLKALRWNIICMSVTRATFQVEMSPLKAAAKANILFMLVTWDTSQLEMSPLKATVQANMLCM